jgi:hypothetical protein
MLLKAQWSNDPLVNTQITNLSGEQVIPKIAVCPNGNYYVGYFSQENNNYNIRLQRLDYEGNALWEGNGLIISEHPSMTWLTDWDLAADNENHAILTWQDIRSGGNNNTVAYRIAPDGEFVWGEDGVMLSSSTAFDVAPKVTVTAENNAVFAWQSDDVIIMQKVNPEGIKQWGEWGITLSCTNRYSWPQLLPVGDDDIIMKFFEDSGPAWAPIRHILAQRFNSDGEPVWENNTVISDAGTMTAWTQILPFINDGNDGFYITWHDYTQSSTEASAWIQHINAEGEAQFQTNGVLLSFQNETNQFYPMLAKLSNDPNLYIYWNEVNGDQNLWGIYGQKISPEGEMLWCSNGKAVFPLSLKSIRPLFTFSSNSEVMLVYENSFSSTENSFLVTCLDNNGEFVWETESLPISSAQSNKVHPEVSKFYNNQWVFTWEDDRTGAINIFAQNLNPDGSLGIPIASGSISGTVSIEGNLADVTEVTITAGEISTSPNEDGLYSITIQPGTYSLTASHPYTVEQTLDGIEVETETITENVDFDLQMLRRNLICHAIDQNSNNIEGVAISVEGPENIYNGTTSSESLVFTEVPFGKYYGTASYNIDETLIVECDTIIDSENGDLYFNFTLTQINPNTIHYGLKVFPNPINQESILEINSKITGSFNLSLLSTSGEIIAHTQSIKIQQGTNTIKLNHFFPIERLASGVYFINISSKAHNVSLRLTLTD